MDLFSPDKWCYHAIATNMDELAQAYGSDDPVEVGRGAGKVVHHGQQVILKLVISL